MTDEERIRVDEARISTLEKKVNSIIDAANAHEERFAKLVHHTTRHTDVKVEAVKKCLGFFSAIISQMDEGVEELIKEAKEETKND